MSLLSSNCATIMHGTKQDVGISSTPTGASVTIDNESHGQTPVIAKLTRKDHHIVRIEMTGYKTFETTITRKTSGWVWGNIVFGGLIGLAVDAISGGLYKLTPEQVSAELAKAQTKLYDDKDMLFLCVILEPQGNWEKIGELERK